MDRRKIWDSEFLYAVMCECNFQNLILESKVRSFKLCQKWPDRSDIFIRSWIQLKDGLEEGLAWLTGDDGRQNVDRPQNCGIIQRLEGERFVKDAE